MQSTERRADETSTQHLNEGASDASSQHSESLTDEIIRIKNELDRYQNEVTVNSKWLYFECNGKKDEKMEAEFYKRQLLVQRAALSFICSFWMWFNLFLLAIDILPWTGIDVTVPPSIKMRPFKFAGPYVIGGRLLVSLVLWLAKILKFFEGDNCPYVRNKWYLVSASPRATLQPQDDSI